jgi:hypothetical protein
MTDVLKQEHGKGMHLEECHKSNVKFVYFTRRENEFENNLVEYANEVYKLKDLFEAPPLIRKYEVKYHNALSEMFTISINAISKEQAEEKFKGAYNNNKNFKLQLVSIKEVISK